VSSQFPALFPAAALGLAVGLRAVGRRGNARGARKPAGPKPVPVDPGYGDPDLTRVRQAGIARDWPAVASVLGPARARGDHDALTGQLDALADLGGDFLLHLAFQNPEDPLVRAAVAARHVTWAWEARTRARASQVSEQQFRLFHDRLRVAEEHAYRAVELDPDSAAPWLTLVIAARGLQHGEEIAFRRFEAGIRRAPVHGGLHRQMLQQLCAKWGGSNEKAQTFARESMLKAPPGGVLGGLVAEAHVENWLELPQSERAAAMASAEVVASLNEAAALSVDHPDFGTLPAVRQLAPLNLFAMAYWLAGEHAAAWRMFVRIGDYPTPSPWQYRGDPSVVFATARAECKRSKQKPRRGKPNQ
jgi:hypothetical protein